MTYPGGHLLVSFNFTVTGTEEIATTGLRCTYPADPLGFDPMSALNAIDSTFLLNLATAMKTLLGNASFLWGNWSNLASMKAAAIAPNGTYLLDPKVAAVNPVWFGASSVPTPFESVVLTLDSGTRIGHARTGRMYLPHCRNATATSGVPYMQGVSTMLAAAKTFLSTVRTQMLTLPGFPEPAILSNIGAGQANRIVAVSMDDVLDVQRRRKNRLRPTRTTLTFP